MCKKIKEGNKKKHEEDHEKELLYVEFPECYVWDSTAKSWSPRKQRQVIGRINGANPIEGERYYLRLLLTHVRCPKSFEDLLMVNDIHCKSFKQSAQKLGLLEFDDSIRECLDEAIVFQMPTALRRLFATILVHYEPTDVNHLWDKYLESLAEDFSMKPNATRASVINDTLLNINFYLESMGKDIKNFDLPPLQAKNITEEGSYPREIKEELDVQISTDDLNAATKLNYEQHTAYTTILTRVEANKSGVFFIDGPGGTGKTYLYRALLATVRSQGMIALATATLGVVAVIMPGGRTAHSRFKIKIPTTDSSMCNISKQDGTSKLLRIARLIIWDEAAMAKRVAIETLDRTLRDLMDQDEPFGGKVIVFGGDFRQVLLVVPHSTRSQTIKESLVSSHLWRKMIKLQLSKNMRAKSDTSFSEFLLRIGNGDEPTVTQDLIKLPNAMLIQNQSDELPEDSLINSIFPSLDENFKSIDYMKDRAILATKNKYVDMLNDRLIKRFPGEEKEFYSFDEADDDTNHHYQEEFLNTLLPNGLPPHKLMLKKYCPIILLRNLDPTNGLCNSTRMICQDFNYNVIQPKITIGQHVGKEVFLPRIPLSPAEDEGLPFKFKRKQFPIRLCFVMTINKSQGQTIPNVGIYLPEPVFSHGQLYVALSRGTSMMTTKILITSDGKFAEEEQYTKNVVYKEVL
ncbi:ATP-dependent DNA helicase PIF1-like [Asparagus officinalis]|uniref:ATP-dependent DNA helicase PIF1-like n=1 Tax=Asparagus officinalis TaxID=4686 RepID=UPI00098E1EBE|nr:ATP-dependent DNA helicase PIF1-like [Asparagus officinalis]